MFFFHRHSHQHPCLPAGRENGLTFLAKCAVRFLLLTHQIAFMKSKIHQAVPELPVKDVERAQAFYQEKLGFKIGWIDPTKTIGAVSKDEAVIFLRKQPTIVPNTHWIFADNVDEIYKEFMEASITITEDIESKPWGIRQFTIEDIDGNRFIFHHDI
jgi:predicted enzyme related to lactoylglutathione lyase